mgnify:CR=1 FL=1
MDNVVSINPNKSEPHQDYEYTVLIKFGDPVTRVQQVSSFGIFDSVEQAEQFIREFPLIKDNYIAEIIPLNRVEVKPINH